VALGIAIELGMIYGCVITSAYEIVLEVLYWKRIVTAFYPSLPTEPGTLYTLKIYNDLPKYTLSIPTPAEP